MGAYSTEVKRKPNEQLCISIDPGSGQNVTWATNMKSVILQLLKNKIQSSWSRLMQQGHWEDVLFSPSRDGHICTGHRATDYRPQAPEAPSDDLDSKSPGIAVYPGDAESTSRKHPSSTASNLTMERYIFISCLKFSKANTWLWLLIKKLLYHNIVLKFLASCLWAVLLENKIAMATGIIPASLENQPVWSTAVEKYRQNWVGAEGEE